MSSNKEIEQDPDVSKKDLMERLQYPADNEFEKIINDYLDLGIMQHHLQQKSNLFVCTNKTDVLADISRKFLFGFNSFQFLQSEALDTKTTTKASAFRWKSDAEPKELVSDLKEKYRKSTVYGNKDVYISEINEDDGGIEVNLNFTIERRGKLQGLAQQKKSTSFVIEDLEEDGPSTVVHEYDKVHEQTAINEYLEGWNKQRIEEEKKSFTKVPITLALLSLENRVKFVRDVMTEELENWTRKNVVGVQVHRDESITGEDQDEDEEQLDSDLEGIRNAALTGNRLDTNEFVKKCEDNGFFLTSVSVGYEHKTLARKIVMEIEFKQNRRYGFEVSIKQSEKKTDGEWESAYFNNDRKNIREEFREMVLELYDEYEADYDVSELGLNP